MNYSHVIVNLHVNPVSGISDSTNGRMKFKKKVFWFYFGLWFLWRNIVCLKLKTDMYLKQHFNFVNSWIIFFNITATLWKSFFINYIIVAKYCLKNEAITKTDSEGHVLAMEFFYIHAHEVWALHLQLV